MIAQPPPRSAYSHRSSPASRIPAIACGVRLEGVAATPPRRPVVAPSADRLARSAYSRCSMVSMPAGWG
jgi:hypothetical protein